MSPFEAIKHEDDSVEYWSARELATVLGTRASTSSSR